MSSVNIWEWVETQEPAGETQRKDLEKQEENTRTFCATKENFQGATPSRSGLYTKPDDAERQMNYTGKGVHLMQGVRTRYGAVEAGERGANMLACCYYYILKKGYSHEAMETDNSSNSFRRVGCGRRCGEIEKKTWVKGGLLKWERIVHMPFGGTMWRE